MELFRYFIIEYLKNNCPYLFYLFNGENGIVYLVVFAVVAVILLFVIIFLIDTFLGSKNILKFIKYKKACDSEIEKSTNNNYLFYRKKVFFKITDYNCRNYFIYYIQSFFCFFYYAWNGSFCANNYWQF